LVFIVNQQADRRTGSPAFESAGKNLYRVVFTPLRSMPRGSRLAPIEIMLQIGLVKVQPGRATVHDASNCATVTLTE
jgi:hypothetical protein